MMIKKRNNKEGIWRKNVENYRNMTKVVIREGEYFEHRVYKSFY